MYACASESPPPQVSGDIPVDYQMRVRQQRQRVEAHLLEELRQGKKQRLNQIREVVAELLEQFGENHDPTGALGQVRAQGGDIRSSFRVGSPFSTYSQVYKRMLMFTKVALFMSTSV